MKLGTLHEIIRKHCGGIRIAFDSADGPDLIPHPEKEPPFTPFQDREAWRSLNLFRIANDMGNLGYTNIRLVEETTDPEGKVMHRDLRKTWPPPESVVKGPSFTELAQAAGS